MAYIAQQIKTLLNDVIEDLTGQSAAIQDLVIGAIVGRTLLSKHKTDAIIHNRCA